MSECSFLQMQGKQQNIYTVYIIHISNYLLTYSCVVYKSLYGIISHFYSREKRENGFQFVFTIKNNNEINI